MNNTSGWSAGSAPYEYTVAEKKTRTLCFKRAALVALYVLWVIGWLLAGVMIKLIVPLLAFIPISLWILVFFTWRLTQVEYEFSFFSGEMTVSRVLGSRSRRALCTVKMRDVELLIPCSADGADVRIDRFAPHRVIYAASSEDSPALFAALFKDGNGTPTVLYFEPDEKARKIVRYYNATAISSAHVKFDPNGGTL
ncbi:MAG: hypothetical protein IJZ80_03030 [Clostridia bacterium]|nr:hypothetical protein [Clostridia bacterium]